MFDDDDDEEEEEEEEEKEEMVLERRVGSMSTRKGATPLPRAACAAEEKDHHPDRMKTEHPDKRPARNSALTWPCPNFFA